MKLDKKGRPRPDGYKMEVVPEEAALIRRIFNQFAEGKAISAIVRGLNKEGVPGRFKDDKPWGPGTIKRILKNEKYIGVWA